MPDALGYRVVVSAATGAGDARKDTARDMAIKPRKTLLSFISLFLLFIVIIEAIVSGILR
jgi:hypothetical protein